MDIKADRSYQKSHEWVKSEGDIYVIGISDYAQHSLGDIVFVELPEVGASFSQGNSFGVVESVKAASDIFLPLSGEIVEVNHSLNDNPELINGDPFEKGWIVKIKATDDSQFDSLLKADAYSEYLKDLEE